MSEEKPYSVFENQDGKVIVCGKRPVLFMNANLEKITDALNKEITPMIEALDEKNLKIMNLIERNAELEAHSRRLLDVAREQQKTIEALEAFAEYIMRETDNIIEELGYKSLEAMNRETTRMDIRVFVSELQKAKKLTGKE